MSPSVVVRFESQRRLQLNFRRHCIAGSHGGSRRHQLKSQHTWQLISANGNAAASTRQPRPPM